MSLDGIGAKALAEGGGVIVAVAVAPPRAVVKVGDEVRFAAVVADAEGKAYRAPTVYWCIADDAEAQVGGIAPDGEFLALRPGVCNVIARVGKVAGHATVTVIGEA